MARGPFHAIGDRAGKKRKRRAHEERWPQQAHEQDGGDPPAAEIHRAKLFVQNTVIEPGAQRAKTPTAISANANRIRPVRRATRFATSPPARLPIPRPAMNAAT